MIDYDKKFKIEITSTNELRDWLEDHHHQSESVWLVTFKKSTGDKYVSVSEVLDELICFGWIDGIRRKLDDVKTMQLISPRKTQHWSQTCKDRAMKLEAEGKMHPSGLKCIAASKSNGMWDFLEDVDRLIIPDDLKMALEKRQEAYEFFITINDSSKRFALRWLKLAKTEKTRVKRIQKLVELSVKSEKLPGS